MVFRRSRRTSRSNIGGIQSTTTTTTYALTQWKRVRQQQHLLLLFLLLLSSWMVEQPQRTPTNPYSTTATTTTTTLPILLCHAFTSLSSIPTFTAKTRLILQKQKVVTSTTTTTTTTCTGSSLFRRAISISSISSKLTSSRSSSSSNVNVNENYAVTNIVDNNTSDVTTSNTAAAISPVIPLSTSMTSTSSTTSSNNNSHFNDSSTTIPVPTTLQDALRIFFFSSQYHGPRLIVAFLSILFYLRMELLGTATTSTMMMISFEEMSVASIAIIFWWFQEHFLHSQLLHSRHMNWIGKEIHVQHHNQPYYHISIDPAPIMISWLVAVHIILRFGFTNILGGVPLHLIYTATIAYGIAGLFYEWTHYIVHTKVRFPSNSFWTKVKNHHARHHLVNHDNYFAFTITQIDDIFGTNPDITKVPRLKKMKKE